MPRPAAEHPRETSNGEAALAENLDAELDELHAAAKQHLARHEPITDPKWPNGARIAVNFTADFDAMLLRRLMNEPPMQLAKGEFGGRVGIWRLIELFDSHDAQGHDLHAWSYLRALSARPWSPRRRAATRSPTTCGSTAFRKEPELERDHLTRSTEALEKLAGSAGVGTRSRPQSRTAAGARLHLPVRTVRRATCRTILRDPQRHERT